MMTFLLVDWSFIWLVTGVGFLMVIILLIILMYIMKGLGAIVSRIADKSAKSSYKKKDDEITKLVPAAQTDEEEIPVAAIAMALHLYYNSVHDEEPTRINIRRIDNQGSPWNNKSFGMNNLHR